MQAVYNVLITTMSLDIGGAETHIVELAKGLKREGFHVVVASNGGIFEKELEAHGIRHYKVPLHNKKPGNVIKAYSMLKEIILKEKINLVHAHARIPGYICNLLHKKLDFAFVTTAHGTWKTGGGLKYITKWGQKTIAVSQDVKKYLLDNYNINESDITLTINGIDTDKFSPDIEWSSIQREFNVPEDSFKVVYVSRIDKDRQEILQSILEVLKGLVFEMENLQFFIVGGGSIQSDIKEAAEKLNRSVGRKTVIVTGPRTDINKFNAMADLFIGFGRSALEGMSSAKPVIIAGNQGYIGLLDEHNIETAVKSNFSGRGQEMAGTESFAAEIKGVAAMDDELRKKYGYFCRTTVEQHYSTKRMVADNIDVYMQLLQ
jgi:glycosyltransferase involved in cell wall biosynthesis